MFNKLKQFKNLRNQAKQLQNALSEEEIEVEKSGIRIKMNGNQEIISVDVDRDLLNPDKKEQIEKAIKEANLAAIEKTKRIMAQKMQSLGGFDQFGLGGEKN